MHRMHWHSIGYMILLTGLIIALNRNRQATALAHQPLVKSITPLANTSVPDRFIIMLHEGNPDTVNRIASQYQVAYQAQVVRTFQYVSQGFVLQLAPETQQKALAALNKDQRIASVTQDRYLQLETSAFNKETVQPNPSWGLDRIDQRSKTLDYSYTYEQTGADVWVYVLDTGIRTSHQEFEGRASSGYDAIDNSQSTTDCHGHGTYVAGLIGGATYGVAKAVQLISVRVLDCNGFSTFSSVLDGIDWVTEQKKLYPDIPMIANLSLGGEADYLLDRMVQRSIAEGVTYVIAAGNSNSSACRMSPAREPTAITVGAIRRQDLRASFSNYGTCVDLFAPGVSIRSAGINNDSSTHTNSGTSAAAPYVAGVAALYLQNNPRAAPHVVHNALLNASTRDTIPNPGTASPNRLVYSHIPQNTSDYNNDGIPDLIALHRTNTASNTTQVHTLSGADGYTAWLTHTSTTLPTTTPASSWAFVTGEHTGDGLPDLYAIKKSGPTSTEVYILDGADQYQSWSLHSSTLLQTSAPLEAWSFAVGDYNRDGKHDLYALHKDTQNAAALYILDGAHNFKTWLLQTTLPFTASGPASSWAFELADYTQDRIPDLYLIKRQGVISTEVHILDGADAYQSWSLHTTTELPQTGTDNNWEFRIADYNPDDIPDLYAIKKHGAISTELYILNGADQFQSYLLQRATPLHQSDLGCQWDFGSGGDCVSAIPINQVADSCSIGINNYALATKHLSATLNLHAPDATMMKISNNPDLSSVQWQPYTSTVNWMFNEPTSSVATLKLYATFKDATQTTLCNTETQATATLYDRIAPTVHLRIFRQKNLFARRAPEPPTSVLKGTLEFVAHDSGSGIHEMRIQINNTDSPAWEPFKAHVPLETAAGSSITIQVRDLAGNQSRPMQYTLYQGYRSYLPTIKR